MFDPFEILDLKQSYSINLETLENHYFAKQRNCHPDQFTQENDRKKTEALNESTRVNQAYLILKNPLLRAEYLLKSAGVELLSNDPSFLGKVMEWNERLTRGEDLKPELREKEKILFDDLENGFALKDYEMARITLYQLTYVQKLLKQRAEK
jgi:molecular chaperone HscB